MQLTLRESLTEISSRPTYSLPNEDAKILDFGLAKVVTASDDVEGGITASTMAPAEYRTTPGTAPISGLER